jgi:glucose-6-phosphate dehydrogenase assembly protein OpcA
MEDSMTAAPEIRSEKLLKQLGEVWNDLGKNEQEYAVVRACSMTLLVATTGTADEQELGATLGELMHMHPSRYVVLRIVDQPESTFTARVFAQCQLAFGRRQQLCCEQIEFTATRDRIVDFHGVALGLTVPDLPVLLWIKDASLLFQREFEAVLPLARPLIIDSAKFGDAAAGLAELDSRRRAGWRIKDINWTRLTAWRETIAQMFESSKCREAAGSIDTIEVTGTRSNPGADVQYMAAWLAQRLPAATVRTHGGGIGRVRLLAGSRTMEVTGATDALVATGLDGMITRVAAPARPDGELIEEELSILGSDPVYETTLPDALRCARMNA